MSAVAERFAEGRRSVWEAREYRRNRRRHLESYRPDVARAPDPALLGALVADGVACVPGFLAPEVVDHIAAEVRPAVEALSQGRYDGPCRTRSLEEGGLFRVYDPADGLSPAARAFFEHPFIQGIADAMCRDGMHSADRYVDFKSRVGGWDESVDYHFDHWKLRFKAFLLLSDVTPQQAPFTYVLGSHRDALWRQRWEWGYQRKGSLGASLPATSVARVRRRHALQERSYTGRAGDLILADTRGVHSGTELRSGSRLQLVDVFVMNGPETYAC